MTTNQTFKPSEGKREEFRKYLEKNGIMDALTKVLVNLYEEVDKPENALEYILDKLSIQAGQETQKQLIARLDEANLHIKSLEEELEKLKVEPAMLPEDEAAPIAVEEVKEEAVAAEALPEPAEDQGPPPENE
ncbi:unnamed protein product [Phaedon cochleariae]|uniref:c-Myc-binding protein n=1 Tax=Phaedon cochleariae TaxID=80249 RepID=A0A9P0DLR0_PHACE|nr:unnamed protein product [Phaedon cochleariae]